MEKYLSDQRAVVTGASRGIGRSIALELARRGAHIAIHYNSSADAAEQVADEVRQLGVDSLPVQQDLRDHDNLEAFVERIWNQWGESPIWVNNAGGDILTGRAAKLDFNAKLQLLINVDLCGTMLLARAVGRRLHESAGGVIINMGWDQAEVGMGGDSGELFAAVKGGIMSFSRSLAVSLAPAVRVHCVAPGWIRTAWGETAPQSWQDRAISESLLKRWGEPNDVASAVAFLCSPGATFLTGQTIRVNGGSVR